VILAPARRTSSNLEGFRVWSISSERVLLLTKERPLTIEKPRRDGGAGRGFFLLHVPPYPFLIDGHALRACFRGIRGPLVGTLHELLSEPHASGSERPA